MAAKKKPPAVKETDARTAKAFDFHVGTKLREQRTLSGMTQRTLADAVGVTFQQLQKYENGTNRISASRLYDFALALDVGPSFFFDGFDPGTGSRRQGAAGQRTSRLVQHSGRKDAMISNEVLDLIRAYTSISEAATRKNVRTLIKNIAGEHRPSRLLKNP